MLEDKTSTQTMFCCRLPEVIFQNLLVVFRLHDSLTLMRFPVPNALKHPHSIILPLPCFTLETFWKCVLWVEHLNSFSKHRQHLYGQRALFLFHLTKGHVSSMYSFFFSKLSFKLQSSLEVSLLQKWIFFLVCNLAVYSCAGLY